MNRQPLQGQVLNATKWILPHLTYIFGISRAKLIADSGNFKGNTFEHLLMDSWGCLYQNWTGKFASEFEKSKALQHNKMVTGYLWKTVDNPEATERFLYDYRKTIAELIEENYYRQFNELCHQNGLKSHVEVIYGGKECPC